MQHIASYGIVVAFSMFVFTSCEKDFAMLNPDGSQKMTVNCLVNNYEVIQVFVTRSSSFSENSSMIPVSDAVVTLYQDDSLLMVLPYVPSDTIGTFGCYKSSVKGEPAKKYSIKVSHPVYGEASAEDYMPAVPDVANFELVQYQNLSANKFCRYRIRLNDEATTENYYRINVWTWNTHWVYNTNGDSLPEDYYSGRRYDVISPITDSVSDHGWSTLFSDRNFNGAQKEIMVEFTAPDTSYLTKQTILVELHQVSKPHFEFFRTLELYKNSDRNTDPYPVFNNIINGYGVFMTATINQTYVTVK